MAQTLRMSIRQIAKNAPFSLSNDLELPEPTRQHSMSRVAWAQRACLSDLYSIPSLAYSVRSFAIPRLASATSRPCGGLYRAQCVRTAENTRDCEYLEVFVGIEYGSHLVSVAVCALRCSSCKHTRSMLQRLYHAR